MKVPFSFLSSLADSMSDFFFFKQRQGYDYAGSMNFLKPFDHFLAENAHCGSILQAEDLERYCSEISHMKMGCRKNRLSVLRQFTQYLHAVEPESAMLPKQLLPRKPKSIRFYPLTSIQVSDLMQATHVLRPKNGIRPHCIRFLIGLLYSTGLRIGEATALNIQDIDIKNSTLFVRRGKFHKERIVPMSSSTLEAMKQWLERRAGYAGCEASAPVFIAKWNKRLNGNQALYAFRRLSKHCGLEGKTHPCLHDLRHNYACHNLARWREAEKDVNALLPVLANAMGHVDYLATQIYMHVDAVSLQQASGKFTTHIKQTLENLK